MISGIVTLSARGHGGLVAFGRTVRSRIDALSKAHDLARHGENGIGASPPSLQALLRTLLAPYRSDENRPDAVRITGEDLILGPHATTALALAFHEFATNAAKYGALSNVEGRLSVTCALVDDRVVITWTERGGPPVARAPKGTGSARSSPAGASCRTSGRDPARLGVEGTDDEGQPAARVSREVALSRGAVLDRRLVGQAHVPRK